MQNAIHTETALMFTGYMLRIDCCRICNRWVDCDTDNGSNRNPADPISSEMVLGAVSDYAAVHCGYVGHHCAV